MLGQGVYGSVRLVKKYGLSRAVKSTQLQPFPRDIEFVIGALREERCHFEHEHIIKRFWSRWIDSKFQVCMEVASPVHRADGERVMHDICQALYCMHSYGFIHRDVKPENIVKVGNVYKLIDFGLSRKGKTNHSMTGYTISRWFRPPEMLRAGEDDAMYDGRVDMWSLALTAHMLDTGKPLFRGSVNQILVQYARFTPTGMFKYLVCEYEKRFTAKQLLEHCGVMPIEGKYLGGSRRDKKLRGFVNAALDGHDEMVEELGYEGIYNDL